MRRILRRREILTDEWLYVGEDGADPAGDAPLIVPFAQFRANADFWRGRNAALGLRLSPADAVEDLAADLALFRLVAAEFPGPADGRGFSQGRLLRSRFHFKGELRAVGAGVKQDLIFLMARCGFDSFDLAAGQTFEAAVAALSRYDVAYQPAEPLEVIRQQRFCAAQ
ncbi:MAG TPA: DUF934 domain-containing protein [Steroidobacteraceae bacterium]|nr:DUF934 domain-containing protein [Steroidobacteraceae bacterium]